MSNFLIRKAGPGDAPAVLRLNESEVEWTSPMDLARLNALASMANYYRVAEVDGQVAGFVLAMGEGCAYDNDNFKWFSEHCNGFLYVDRVVVASQYAGQKIGSTLYRDVFCAASSFGLPHIVCEYSRYPRNVPSEKFHARLGFEEIGRRALTGTTKVLSMQRRLLGSSGV